MSPGLVTTRKRSPKKSQMEKLGNGCKPKEHMYWTYGTILSLLSFFIKNETDKQTCISKSQFNPSIHWVFEQDSKNQSRNVEQATEDFGKPRSNFATVSGMLLSLKSHLPWNMAQLTGLLYRLRDHVDKVLCKQKVNYKNAKWIWAWRGLRV